MRNDHSRIDLQEGCLKACHQDEVPVAATTFSVTKEDRHVKIAAILIKFMLQARKDAIRDTFLCYWMRRRGEGIRARDSHYYSTTSPLFRTANMWLKTSYRSIYTQLIKQLAAQGWVYWTKVAVQYYCLTIPLSVPRMLPCTSGMPVLTPET